MQHCFWLGTAIGLHNRKYFVLFVTYSAVFCVMGSAHSWYELVHALPLRLGHSPFPWRNVRALPWRSEADVTWAALTYNVLEWLISGVWRTLLSRIFQESHTRWPTGVRETYTCLDLPQRTCVLLWSFSPPGAHGRIGWFVRLFERAAQPDGPGLSYVFALLASAVLNPLAAAALAGFSLFQVRVLPA